MAKNHPHRSAAASLAELGLGLLVLGLILGGIHVVYPLPVSVVVGAGSAFGAVVITTLFLRARAVGSAPCHAAERITLLRGILLAVIAGHLALTELAAVQGGYLVALAVTAMLLDGLDGYVARRYNQASAYGARLDMEFDALLILTLCALLWRAGPLGVWVLAIGLLRYAFIALQWVYPTLDQTLPSSLGRKTVCVVQMTVLPICLLPGLPGTTAVILALAALALLVYSFAMDTHWLLHNQRATEKRGPHHAPPDTTAADYDHAAAGPE